MQWYKGDVATLFDKWEFGDNPLWADYQALGPSFAAVSVFFGVKDVLPIIIGARGCAVHLRFSIIAWGADFHLDPRPLPFIEISRNEVISGNYQISSSQLEALNQLVVRCQPSLLVLISNDDVLLTCADLSHLQGQVQKGTGIPTEILEVSPLTGSNQWLGYDKALELLYKPYLNENIEKKEGINLVGWKWPSRERKHDIGACFSLLQSIGVKVNHIIPGGCTRADIRDSLASQANLLWCPSYIGDTLENLAKEKGLPIAGYTPPYGMSGTTQWLAELGDAIGRRDEILSKAEKLKDQFNLQLETCKKNLKGKRGFISGGPGRLPGLLDIMADLEVEVVAAALYWPHPSSKQTLSRVLGRLKHPPEILIVSPSLYEIEEIAANHKLDFWMGGYQELHTCKRHEIPFIPTTLYLASHQCYEGVINVGKKIGRAIDGFDFVANVFQSVEG
jgi:nitrogenase molybdenum-iron protein alpha/beta subunit